jgi:hypothetical protein
LIELVKEENLLISLSLDGTCKVTDPATGTALFLITSPNSLNKNNCQFLGLQWIKEESSIYLLDELGHVSIFNLFKEKVVDSTSLINGVEGTLTSSSSSSSSSLSISAVVSSVIKSHSNQLAKGISKYSMNGYFLSIIATPAVSPHSTRVSSKSNNSVGNSNNREAVGVVGDLALWNLAIDGNCTEFIGHQGSILSISVPIYFPSIDETMIDVNKNVDFEMNKMLFKANKSLSSVSEGIFKKSNKASLATSLQVSRAEKLFFSVSQDDSTIRCWDEYDQSENYQFKLKGNSDITVMLCLWGVNKIATGHDNGMVCLWNADTGSK